MFLYLLWILFLSFFLWWISPGTALFFVIIMTIGPVIYGYYMAWKYPDPSVFAWYRNLVNFGPREKNKQLNLFEDNNETIL